MQACHRKQGSVALPLMPLGIKAFEHAQNDQRPGARTAEKQVRHYERAEQTLRLPSHKTSSSEHAPLTERRASPHIFVAMLCDMKSVTLAVRPIKLPEACMARMDG